MGKKIVGFRGLRLFNFQENQCVCLPVHWQGIAEKHRGGVTTEAGTRHGYSRRVQASSLEWRARTLKCMVALRQHRYFQAPDVSLREHLGKETPENWEEIYYRPDPRFNDPIFEGPPCSRPACMALEPQQARNR
ncbi:hypothetical protein MGG_15385 [Pyricularia oryzae 70-15]|uniref:Uncharacterized protein n=1 Tax=Pyricularia oryzae (strain 70-15 / ATCC MYA-4617 / FGSC 8958) TaxID=242507 RepID=G4NKM0_PYRO7|nr:uncharacterized protein MGG_15385 [Pyricularia oryzae 70-15]EHA46609.1 hypothetical protein MGG_15385 [Pyricularia oryzae 70-15]